MDTIVNIAKNAWKSHRLLYRQLDNQDEKFTAWMHENIRNDPTITTLAAGDLLKPRTKSEHKEFMDFFRNCLLAVTICLPPVAKSEGKGGGGAEKGDEQQPTPIGFAVLTPQPGGKEYCRNSEIGICLVQEHRGKGYGSEAINWITDWGFRFAGLHRIKIVAFSYNEHAVSLYQKLGFKVEGNTREYIYFDRKWYDRVEMGMLEQEWEELRKTSNHGEIRGISTVR